ncbi:MAG: hypothetical protein ACK44D_13810 [Bacteroidia bacterium]
MIRFCKHEEIDKLKWDACIKDANNSLIYGYSWYLDIAAPSWNAIILGDYDAVMPIPTVKKIFTVAYQPFFTQQLGIFIKAGYELSAGISEFISTIPKEYKYINICLNEKNDTGAKLNFELKKRSNYLLYLHQSYEQLFKGFSEHNRRYINKSKKNNLTISDTTYEHVVQFYIKNKGTDTDKVSLDDYERLKNLLGEAKQRGFVICKQVKDETGNCIACAVFYVHQKRIIYQIGTSNNVGRDLRAMYFLFDRLIHEYSEQNNLVLDFEGSDIDGVGRFFSGFGALMVPYHRLIANRLPWPINLLKK